MMDFLECCGYRMNDNYPICPHCNRTHCDHLLSIFRKSPSIGYNYSLRTAMEKHYDQKAIYGDESLTVIEHYQCLNINYSLIPDKKSGSVTWKTNNIYSIPKSVLDIIRSL